MKPEGTTVNFQRIDKVNQERGN
jgi:hypothetical protein